MFFSTPRPRFVWRSAWVRCLAFVVLGSIQSASRPALAGQFASCPALVGRMGDAYDIFAQAPALSENTLWGTRWQLVAILPVPDSGLIDGRVSDPSGVSVNGYVPRLAFLSRSETESGGLLGQRRSRADTFVQPERWTKLSQAHGVFPALESLGHPRALRGSLVFRLPGSETNGHLNLFSAADGNRNSSPADVSYYCKQSGQRLYCLVNWMRESLGVDRFEGMLVFSRE